MDGLWDRNKWMPTVCEDEIPGEFQLADSEEYESSVVEVKSLTALIHDFPYNPDVWHTRGIRLMILGYPELAMGDTWKAMLLVDAANESGSHLGVSVRLMMGMKIWLGFGSEVALEDMNQWLDRLETELEETLRRLKASLTGGLIECAFSAASAGDSLHLSREAIRQYPNNAFFRERWETSLAWFCGKVDCMNQGDYTAGIPTHMVMYMLKGGTVKRRFYPWMTGNLLRRSERVLGDIRNSFSKFSKMQKCTVQRSPLERKDKESKNSPKDDVFGVFSIRDIDRGKTLFVDEESVVASNAPNRCPQCCGLLSDKPVFLRCCRRPFCNSKCVRKALQVANHECFCGQTNGRFSFLYAAAQGATSDGTALHNLLMLKLLAMTSRYYPGVNPLMTPYLHHLTPQNGIASTSTFHFVDNVVNPIRMLQALGIDVFANLDYDTWVLQTIVGRIKNNSFGWDIDGQSGLICCAPGSSMFNHSCSPNVAYSRERGGGFMRFMTNRSIRKGEELFIDYNNVEHLPIEERQQELWGWLNGPCRCTKCEGEME